MPTNNCKKIAILIGDLSSVCLENDTERKKEVTCTYYYAPPEYRQRLYPTENSSASLEETMTTALDAWSLGQTLRALWNQEIDIPPYIDAFVQEDPAKRLTPIAARAHLATSSADL